MKNVPFVQQIQETECGLCCVNMILIFFGSDVKMSTLRNKYDIGRDGMSFKQIGDLFKNLHYHVEYYKSNIEGLKDLSNSPSILYWNKTHFVVLEKIKGHKYYIIDPKIGKQILNKNEMFENYSGYAMQISKTDKSVKKFDNNEKTKVYVDFFKNRMVQMLGLMALSILAYISSLAVPVLLKNLVDDIVLKGANGNSYYIVFMLGAIFFYVSTMLIKNVLTIIFSIKMDTEIYRKIISRLFKLPYKFYVSRNSSELLYRLGLLKANRNYLVEKIISSTFNIFNMFLLLIIVAITEGVIVAGLLSIITIILLAILIPIQNKIQYLARLSLNLESELQSKEYQAITSIYAIKSIGISSFFLDNLYKAHSKSLNVFQKKSQFENYFTTTVSSISLFVPLILIIVLVFLDLELSPGDLFSLVIILGYYFDSFSNVLASIVSFIQFKLNNEKLDDILHSKRDLHAKNKIQISAINTIEFRDVYYKYPGQSDYAINKMNILIRRADKLGFVGKTGSGKSTFLNLLMGMLEPTQGRILVNGVNLKDIDIECYRGLIGYVPQETFIVNTSIKENILLGRKYNKSRFQKSLKLVVLDEEISKFPMGEDTILSEGGTNISGGQRQRISIARSLLDDPNVVIFDEATSSIDNYTQRRISDQLELNNSTQIIVTHRLTTVNKSYIYVLDGGQIVEQGEHDELLSNKSFYYKLYTGGD